MSLVLQKLKNEGNKGNDKVKKSDLEDKKVYFIALENFFKYFPWKFEAYDPLGRVVPDNLEESMALDEYEMKKKL